MVTASPVLSISSTGLLRTVTGGLRLVSDVPGPDAVNLGNNLKGTGMCPQSSSLHVRRVECEESLTTNRIKHHIACTTCTLP